MKYSKKILCVCFFLILPVFLYSQTAEEIENLLNVDEVNYQQAAWLVLMAAQEGNLSQAEAFNNAMAQGWFPSNVTPNGRAKLNVVSLLIMQSFDIRGGVFYSFIGSPHYAYRELVYRGIIQGKSDPAMAVSGDLLLFLVNRVLAFQEANQL